MSIMADSKWADNEPKRADFRKCYESKKIRNGILF